MSDELYKIFNKDLSYEKKVEEVKKLANKHLEEANLYLLNSIFYIGIGLFFYHSLFMFFSFIPIIFGCGFISCGCFDMFLNRKKTAKDMLNHVENANGSLFTENNNNNNIRKKKVKELKEKKECEEQKSKKFMNLAIILMILSFIFIPTASFISSSFIIPVGLGMSIAQIPSLVKVVQSIKKQELIQGEIDKLNFDILSYEDRFSKKKNHTINSDNLNNKEAGKNNVNGKQSDNSILDAYLKYICKSGNDLEDERPKTYSKK